MAASTVRGLLRRVYHGSRERLGRLVYERGDFAETGSWVQLEELGGDPEHTRYEASGWTYLRRALRRERIGSEHVFIDYGSGKGRVVLQAARYPFGRVMGVEISEELNRVARRNFEANRERLRCQSFEAVTANVSEWDPPDDITHAYLFNPFSGSVFHAAVDGLVRSYDRRPRDLKIIYANPTLADVLTTTGRVRHVRTTKGIRRSLLSRQISIYAVTPAAEPDPPTG